MLLKKAINERDINPLDICFLRTLVLFVGTLIISFCMKQSFFIQKQDRCVLAVRSLMGMIGFTAITFGVAMIPLLVQNTIFNTAPFWASLLGWIFLGEAITRFETVAMFLSFAGVVMIALAPQLLGSDDEVEVSEAGEDGKVTYSTGM